jgi:hypothetical protein
VAINAVGVSAGMRVRISNADLLKDLHGYLEAAECRVRKVGQVTLDVTMNRAPSAEQAEREVAIYLKTWTAMNPGSYARIVGEGSETPPA